MKLPVVVDIDMEDLADSLNTEEAMKLIQSIDLAQADWDFTMEVTKHFLGIIVAGEYGNQEHLLELKGMLA